MSILLVFISGNLKGHLSRRDILSGDRFLVCLSGSMSANIGTCEPGRSIYSNSVYIL